MTLIPLISCIACYRLKGPTDDTREKSSSTLVVSLRQKYKYVCTHSYRSRIRHPRQTGQFVLKTRKFLLRLPCVRASGELWCGVWSCRFVRWLHPFHNNDDSLPWCLVMTWVQEYLVIILMWVYTHTRFYLQYTFLRCQNDISDLQKPLKK